MFLQNKAKAIQIKTADYGLQEELNAKASSASFAQDRRAMAPATQASFHPNHPTS